MKFQAQGALKAVEIADRCESATRPRMAGVESSHKPVEEPEGSAAALDEPFGDSTDGEFWLGAVPLALLSEWTY